MNADKTDPLIAANCKLRQCLAEDFHGNETGWSECVHDALAQVAAAIQDQVRDSEQSLKTVGDINPDFQAPFAERHVEWARDRLIQLGERVHQLRADLRNAAETSLPLDQIQMRLRGQEIADGIDDVRHEDDKFLLDAVTSNPGAGD
jgi:hypothetical protein